LIFIASARRLTPGQDGVNQSLDNHLPFPPRQKRNRVFWITRLLFKTHPT